MKISLSGLSLAALLFTGCGTEQPAAPPTDDNGDAQQNEDHGHTDNVQLGTTVLGKTPITVHRLSAIRPGAEVDIDIEAAADTPLEQTIRGWIGTESAQGSRKGRFAKMKGNKMHGHIEVPDPMPAGSKLWLQAGDETASVALDN